MSGIQTVTSGPLKKLAERLAKAASPEIRARAVAEAGKVARGIVFSETEEHIKSGTLHNEANIVESTESMDFVGPRYTRFVKGLRIGYGFSRAEHAEFRQLFVNSVLRDLGFEASK